MNYEKRNKHMTLDDRIEIQECLNKGMTVLVKQNCNSYPQNQAERFCQGVRPLLNE